MCFADSHQDVELNRGQGVVCSAVLTPIKGGGDSLARPTCWTHLPDVAQAACLRADCCSCPAAASSSDTVCLCTEYVPCCPPPPPLPQETGYSEDRFFIHCDGALFGMMVRLVCAPAACLPAWLGVLDGALLSVHASLASRPPTCTSLFAPALSADSVCEARPHGDLQEAHRLHLGVGPQVCGIPRALRRRHDPPAVSGLGCWGGTARVGSICLRAAVAPAPCQPALPPQRTTFVWTSLPCAPPPTHPPTLPPLCAATSRA